MIFLEVRIEMLFTVLYLKRITLYIRHLDLSLSTILDGRLGGGLAMVTQLIEKLLSSVTKFCKEINGSCK